MDKLYLKSEVCENLRISEDTLERIVMRGDIEAFRVGASLRFTQKSIDDYIQQQMLKMSDRKKD